MELALKETTMLKPLLQLNFPLTKVLKSVNRAQAPKYKMCLGFLEGEDGFVREGGGEF